MSQAIGIAFNFFEKEIVIFCSFLEIGDCCTFWLLFEVQLHLRNMKSVFQNHLRMWGGEWGRFPLSPGFMGIGIFLIFVYIFSWFFVLFTAVFAPHSLGKQKICLSLFWKNFWETHGVFWKNSFAKVSRHKLTDIFSHVAIMFNWSLK